MNRRKKKLNKGACAQLLKYAGKWTKQEYKAFNKALKSQRKTNPKIWSS